MTTNVYDGNAGVVATDSRWTYANLRNETYGLLYGVTGYVDNTGFNKIAVNKNHVFAFAGAADLIGLWKKYVMHSSLLPIPRVGKGFSLCWINKTNMNIFFEHGQNKNVSTEYHKFAGTGAEAAHKCWSKNGDAKRAVSSAILEDPCSGGEVKFVDLKNKNSNLAETPEVDNIATEFLKKGLIMQTGAYIPVKEAIKDDPMAQEFVRRIKDGSIQAQAPNGYDVEWTDDCDWLWTRWKRL